jgi:pentapeptide MXKDX repeat protein
VRNKRRPLSNLWKVTSVAEPKKTFRGDCYVMIKRTALILSAATLSFGLALASTAQADDAMKKDTMSKDAMSNDAMKKDSMSKDSLSKDAMSKDAVQGYDVEGQHEKRRNEEELAVPRRVCAPGEPAALTERQCLISCSRCSPEC